MEMPNPPMSGQGRLFRRAMSVRRRIGDETGARCDLHLWRYASGLLFWRQIHGLNMRRIKESICARSSCGWYALLTAGLAAVFCATAAIADPLPNIVYILVDDMGMGDVRSYNPNSPVNTPNIDRIANAGMRFND